MYFDGRGFEGDFDPGPRRPGSKVNISRPRDKFHWRSRTHLNVPYVR